MQQNHQYFSFLTSHIEIISKDSLDVPYNNFITCLQGFIVPNNKTLLFTYKFTSSEIFFRIITMSGYFITNMSAQFLEMISTIKVRICTWHFATIQSEIFLNINYGYSLAVKPNLSFFWCLWHLFHYFKTKQ